MEDTVLVIHNDETTQEEKALIEEAKTGYVNLLGAKYAVLGVIFSTKNSGNSYYPNRMLSITTLKLQRVF